MKLPTGSDHVKERILPDCLGCFGLSRVEKHVLLGKTLRFVPQLCLRIVSVCLKTCRKLAERNKEEAVIWA